MHNNFIFMILVIGLSGIVAQVLLLHELLVSFYSNELILGVILAYWLAEEGQELVKRQRFYLNPWWKSAVSRSFGIL